MKLVVPPSDQVDEDGSTTKSVASLPLKALVRVRIPLNRPLHQDVSRIEDANDDEEGAGADPSTSRTPVPDSAREHQQLSTHPDEDTSKFTEQPMEDRAFVINPASAAEGARIWVLHQAASRQLRKDMAIVLKKAVKELESIDNDEFMQAIEHHAVEVEKNFVKIFSSEEPNQLYD